MSSQFKKAVFRSLSYSDVFDFPLTINEISKYLIGVKSDKNNLLKTVKNIPLIKEKNGFYFLKGREKIVDRRIYREKISDKKLKIARRFARLLFQIPSIKVIAITGSLALLSSDINDDIDLLIITAKNRIWQTRFFCVLFLKSIGVYRNPRQFKAPDKICINMFLDEEHLTLPDGERDLYSAHEIVQMKPVFVRPGFENIMQRSNPWLKKYLPNASNEAKGASLKNLSRWHLDILNKFLDFLELILKNFQLFYMKSSRTREVIREGYLRFHPHDARISVLRSYNLKLTKYLK